ncbi:MAG: DUF2339 domain-containing protein [Chloroflexota bacterium]
MMASISCPTCGYDVSETDDFCPNCGRPRTATQQRIEEDARRQGIPYIQLLDEERRRAGIALPSAITIRRIEDQLRQIDETLNDLDSRIEQVERRVLGTRRAPHRPGAERPAPAQQPEGPISRPSTPPVPEQRTEQTQPGAAEEIETRDVELAPEVGAPSRVGWRDTYLPDRSGLEDLFSGRILAWAGGLAIVIGSIFFLSMAFSQGWIGPELRVLIGVVSAIAMLAAGAWFSERREQIFAYVLIAVSLGVMNISLLAATRLYDLLPVQAALFAALATSAIAALIAIRANAQLVAILGLVAVLIAPILFGSEPTFTTATFIGVILLATTAIALYRTWRWLPPVAFFLSVVQVGDFLTGDIHTILSLLTIVTFWLLYAIGAGGEEFRTRRGRLSITSATLLIFNALFAIAMGFEILDGANESWRGPYLVALALANGCLGGYFLRDRGERHPFGMLAMGTGVAVFTMAIPVQFGGEPVPIAWSAEAAALTWIYSLRRHGYAGVYALAPGLLAIGHLMLFEYPVYRMFPGIEMSRPFLNGNGLTLGFLIGSLALSAYFMRDTRLSAGPVIAAAALAAYATPFELSDAFIVLSWSLLIATLLYFSRTFPRSRAPYLAASAGLFTIGLLYTLASIAPPRRLAVQTTSEIDHTVFISDASAALGLLILVLMGAIWLYRDDRSVRITLGPLAGALAVYLLSVGLVDEFQRQVGEGTALATLQERAQVGLSILWAVLGGSVFVTGVVRFGAPVRLFGLALLALATAKVFLVDLAALDTSYRVLSFIGLGILLLASSFAYQHFKPRLISDDEHTPADGTA